MRLTPAGILGLAAALDPGGLVEVLRSRVDKLQVAECYAAERGGVVVRPGAEPVNPCADCGDDLTRLELADFERLQPPRRLCHTCTVTAPGRERHRLKLQRRAQRAGPIPAVEG